MGLFEEFPYTNFQDLNLDTLLIKMKETLAALAEMQKYVGGFDDRIKSLENYIDRLESGIYTPAFITHLYNWLHNNMPDILSDTIKQVWFGLTDSGYFVAYVPESWSDIQFNTTGYDYFTDLQPNFGHLVLSAKGGN